MRDDILAGPPWHGSPIGKIRRIFANRNQPQGLHEPKKRMIVSLSRCGKYSCRTRNVPSHVFEPG